MCVVFVNLIISTTVETMILRSIRFCSNSEKIRGLKTQRVLIVNTLCALLRESVHTFLFRCLFIALFNFISPKESYNMFLSFLYKLKFVLVLQDITVHTTILCLCSIHNNFIVKMSFLIYFIITVLTFLKDSIYALYMDPPFISSLSSHAQTIMLFMVIHARTILT